jgi:glycosyltransferase involved in cell wall biosynthesis
MSPREISSRWRLSVVVPVLDEEAVLPEFHRRLAAVLDGLQAECEIVYVDDGSLDRSGAILRELNTGDGRVAVLELSRHFGKEIALTAGLDHADGDAVVVIDSDLQDPPELIPQLVERWREGYDVVYAQRSDRAGETVFKRATAWLFYRLVHRLGGIHIPRNTGDFRLLSRRAVLALRQLRERNRFMKGLFAWVGFPQVAVPYRREPRHAGATKWSFWKLWTLALEGVTSFTTAPLKIATYLGLVVAVFAFLYGAWIISKTLLYGNPVAGYPSLMVVILFLGGVQLIAIGLVGEYIARMFDETKGRPLYLVNSFRAPRSASRVAEAARPHEAASR